MARLRRQLHHMGRTLKVSPLIRSPDATGCDAVAMARRNGGGGSLPPFSFSSPSIEAQRERLLRGILSLRLPSAGRLPVVALTALLSFPPL